MINLIEIDKAICKGIKGYIDILYPSLGFEFIRQNQTAPKPEYPYGTYTITTCKVPNKGTYSIEHNNYKDLFEYTKQVGHIWSITIQSDDETEAQLIIEQIHDWLDVIGYEYLKDNGIVVLSIENIIDRGNDLSIEYEYRYGLDVTFTLLDKIENKVETIDNANINNI